MNANPYKPIKINGAIIDLSTPNIEIDNRGPREQRMRVRDAYVNYNQNLRPAGWEKKELSIPLAPQNEKSDPFNNSIEYTPAERGARSPDTSDNRRSCNLIRQNFGIECKDDYNELDQCQIDEPEWKLKRKHDKFMRCRNARAVFQNSNCRAGDIPAPGEAEREFMNPQESGHVERIYTEARYAKKCVKAYIMRQIKQIFSVLKNQFNIANIAKSGLRFDAIQIYMQLILKKIKLIRNVEDEKLLQAAKTITQELAMVQEINKSINDSLKKMKQKFIVAEAIYDRAIVLFKDNNVPENDIVDTDTDTNINTQLTSISKIEIVAGQIRSDVQKIEESYERVKTIYEELRENFSHFFNKSGKSSGDEKEEEKKDDVKTPLSKSKNKKFLFSKTKKSTKKAKKSTKKVKKSVKKTKKSVKKTKKSVRNNKKTK